MADKPMMRVKGKDLAGSEAGTAVPVHTIRGERVILDSDLAALYETETRVFNQAFKRQRERSRFPREWAFELNEAEVEDLRSQNVIPSGGWGGRRTPPWAFTEHGVVLAATMLQSDRAAAVMRFVVDVFVKARRGKLARGGLPAVEAQSEGGAGGPIAERLQGTLKRVLEHKIDDQKSLREEAQSVLKDSLGHVKAKLKRAEFESDEIAARTAKLLAEAEAAKASAAKTKAETEAIRTKMLATKLRLMLQAEQALAQDQLESFLKLLEELGGE
ncbi:MAG: ORF6N domain-containing protein [Hyphomicrobiaceae bacterium]